MYLRMDLDGILLQLKIKGYEPSDGSDYYDKWCKVDFSFSSGSWLNYRNENDEVLLSCEVEELAEMIQKLLENEITEATEKNCIEPDFHFILNPIRDLRADPKYVYVRKGYELADVYMEWIISFWNNGLTDNYLSVSLDRNDLEILLTYLNFVIGKISTKSPEFKKLVSQGFLAD